MSRAITNRELAEPLAKSGDPFTNLRRAISGWILPDQPLPSGDTDRPLWLSYVATLGLVTFITAVGLLIGRRIAATNLAMLYLLTVVISALRWGNKQAIVCALSAAVAFDFFFVPPYRTFAVTDTWYLITTVTLLGVGLVVGALASEAREQANRSRRREAVTSTLHLFSQALIGTSRIEQILEVASRHIADVVRCHLLVLLPRDRELTVCFRSPDFHFDEDEKAVAEWAFEHAQDAGRGTNHLPETRGHYLPLRTAWRVEGVLGVEPFCPTESLSPERKQVLDLLASRTALAIERALLDEQAREARLLQETDRLQKALLNTVSHNLRTPLASVTGTLGTLLEDVTMLDEATRNELLENAYEQATHLNRLVGNLLDMSRLAAGAIRLKIEPGDVQDVVGAALAQLGNIPPPRKVVPAIPANLPMVPMDFVLITQVLVNLVDNALKYSPPDEPIEIRAQPLGDCLEVLVSDGGPGIADADLERVFEKFNRGGRTGQTGGFGLGLSICKGFVEAHGGRIWAERRGAGGTVITFTLPLKSQTASREPIDERTRSANTSS